MTQRTVVISKQYLITANVVRQLLVPVPAPSVISANSPLCSSLGLLWNDTFLCHIYILGLNHFKLFIQWNSLLLQAQGLFESFLLGLGSTFSAILFLEFPCCVVECRQN